MNNKIVWTESKLQYLIEHYPTDTANDIADVIGCSDFSVSRKAKELGIRKSPDFKRWNFIGRYIKQKKHK